MWTNHQTEPEPGLKDKQYPLPHGKIVGGSSAVNGLVHVRGTPFDYNTWEKNGADGWGYDDVLPYLKKYEHYRGAVDKDRKSTRLNSSHVSRSYAVFCLKKKTANM